MTTSKIVPTLNSFLEKRLAPFAPWVNPNVVTIFAMIFPLITFVLIINGYFAFAALSMLLFLFDKLDGVFARAGNKVSQWGGLLDATLDRITDSSVYIALGISGSANWVLCSVAMVAGFLVSYSKAKAEAGLGIRNIGSNQLSIGLMERTERLVVIGVAIFFYQFFKDFQLMNFSVIDIALIVSIVLTIFTFFMRMQKAHELLSQTN